MEKQSLSRNSLAFIALANEYCHDLEHTSETERDNFVANMLKLLPRIYIAASDIEVKDSDESESFYAVDSYLIEDNYNAIKNIISQLLEDEDDYLEVFEEDMKFSDTPIATTISENLSDIYQDLFNFVAAIEDAPTEIANQLISSVKESFDSYWGQTLLNVLRALHNVRYNHLS